MQNSHDLSADELQQVFHDAEVNYLLTNDAAAYTIRLAALGITTSEIKTLLREIDIKRAEAFNQRLATLSKGRRGKAA